MDIFTKEELKELALTQASPCVSLYMPTFHVEAELQQNPIRFKNLLRKGRQQLHDEGYREQEVEQVMGHLQGAAEASDFWRTMSDGLAVFATPEGVQFFRLPIAFEELVVTGKRLHLKPLFPIIATNNAFYVLALSQTHVRLFQGTHYSINEVQTAEIPKHILEVLWADDFSSDLSKLQQGDRHERAAENAQFHGHGMEPEDLKHQPHDELRRFFQEINRGIHETLREERAPMVLAGVEYYLPIYREVNGYKHLVDDKIIPGSPVRVDPKELHGKAWELVEPLFLERQKEAVEHYHHLKGNNAAFVSDDIHEVLPAAVFSRVETLFVPVGSHLWGRYEMETNVIELHDEQAPGDDDLLDLAAVHTYLNGGAVHALRTENMPTDESIAATFRYPAEMTAEEYEIGRSSQ